MGFYGFDGFKTQVKCHMHIHLIYQKIGLQGSLLVMYLVNFNTPIHAVSSLSAAPYRGGEVCVP